jgi:hypothetical protein
LINRQRHDAFAFVTGEAQPHGWVVRHQAISTAALNIERSVPTTSRKVLGDSLRDRSVAHACTSDGRSATSRLEPSGVASMWVLINVAVRAAVLTRWGRAAAHCLAYSLTVIMFDRST